MVELAEDEMRRYGEVWLTIFASLGYCFVIGKIIPKGFKRFFAICPVNVLFLVLPLNLSSFILCGVTAFAISWLANIKLLLFAFGKPPLGVDSPTSFARFVALACLPIEVQDSSQRANPNSDVQMLENHTNLRTLRRENDDSEVNNRPYSSPEKLTAAKESDLWNYIVKGLIWMSTTPFYIYQSSVPNIILGQICFVHIYVTLDLALTCITKAANLGLGSDLKTQFNQPLSCTSLQNFWGQRWNLMVKEMMRVTVYLPVRDISTRIVGQHWAPIPAVMMSFLVSGLMHELIFYHLGRMAPTFEVTTYFLVHGLCVCLEVIAKNHLGAKQVIIPAMVSRTVTVSILFVTGACYFFPPLLRTGLAPRCLHEYAAVYRFLRTVICAGFVAC